MARKIKILAHDPRIVKRENAGIPEFEQIYELLVDLAHGLRDENLKPYYFGDANQRLCAICGKRAPQATFTKTSHIIPVALGNRSYLSNEECDVCNEEYADKHDNELANMFLPHRVVSRVRPRKGSVKLQAPIDPALSEPKKRAYIEAKNADGSLLIAVRQDDDSVSFERTSASTAQLSVYQSPFSAGRAVKSILRSAWLLLSKSEREEHEIMLKIIKGEIQIDPLEYYEIFVPDYVAAVAIEVWKKKTSTMAGYPQLIVRFTLSNNMLVMTLPDTKTIRFYPAILPPIICFEGAEQKIQIDRCVIPKPEERFPAGKSIFDFTFSEYISHADAGTQLATEPIHRIKSQQKKSYPQFTVDLELITQERKYSIAGSVLTQFRHDHQESRYAISGGTFAGELIVHIKHKEKQITFHHSQLTEFVHLVNPETALRTLEFLEAIKVEKGTLRVVIIDSKETILELPTLDQKSDYYQKMKWFLDALVTINLKLGLSLRVLPPPCKLPLGETLSVAEAIKNGIVDFFTDDPIHLTVSRTSALRLIQVYKNGTSPAIEGHWSSDLLGQQIDLGKIYTVFEDPKFTGLISDVERSILNSQDDVFKISFTCMKVTHYFHRYASSEKLTELMQRIELISVLADDKDTPSA